MGGFSGAVFGTISPPTLDGKVENGRTTDGAWRWCRRFLASVSGGEPAATTCHVIRGQSVAYGNIGLEFQ